MFAFFDLTMYIPIILNLRINRNIGLIYSVTIVLWTRDRIAQSYLGSFQHKLQLFSSLIFASFLNPLSPDIHLQILHTDLYTFPLRISWENLKKDQGIFTLVIILLILITFSFDNVWIYILGRKLMLVTIGT